MTAHNHPDLALATPALAPFLPAAANDAAAPRRPVAVRIPAIRLFGLDLADITPDRAVAELLAPGRRRVAFLNAHCGNVMARDPDYAATLATADMVLPDGIGVELAARMTGRRFTANLNGTDLVPQVMAEAARRGLSVFLFGAAPGVARAAAQRLARDTPNLRIAGTRDGYEGARDTAAAIAEINASGADILLVAMGVPLQDCWLADHAHELSPRITMGVGALFDFLSGRVARAPLALRRMHMEWCWRLALEPRRLFGRYVTGNAAFLIRAARDALACGGTLGLKRRTLDLALAGGALLALGPLMLLIAVAIRLESPGPALFRQTRIGRDGRPFTVFKFRSMYRDAEARRAALLAGSDREGICFKARNDPRVTRMGRLLRRTSLDELPQILNILRGEMSVVGPRPALPEEVAAYPARARERLACRPGLTGLWQVSGRAELSFERMVEMDIAHARSASILLDLVVIALTFRALWTGRGAY
ncbi:WecB/TagA/CpsF family glycosyltransferase [Frigidibacter sp. MR17.14]|uniref:WecB/TagA/CpsF family glycosyltransferase n=1 Tax=Frigidibacter sp. MR17.14 TaxID=3126509 RepID=UPI00301305F0